jgi:hypothetical protein
MGLILFMFARNHLTPHSMSGWIICKGGDGIRTVTRTRWTGKRHETDTYRYAQSVPLRDGKAALHVQWFELVTTDEAGKEIYRNAFVTNHAVSDKNVAEAVEAGRGRWKIENENNNTLKTKGYHFEHNYGHGKKHLSSLLASLIILAFLTHTVMEWMDDKHITLFPPHSSSLPLRREDSLALWERVGLRAKSKHQHAHPTTLREHPYITGSFTSTKRAL